jgi:hypothetical protein
VGTAYVSWPGAASSCQGCGRAAGSGAGAGAARTFIPARTGRIRAESLRNCIVKVIVENLEFEVIEFVVLVLSFFKC